MRPRVTLDGNEAAATVAYMASEVIAIYPITPASPMGELADKWAAQERPNIWGSVPRVVEMQSEGGAAGAVHGALQTGALTTTFTASQGLLLMIPNMYKIAGELTPAVIHIAARSLATHALSIFCDHSDVMSARGTGFGMLFGNSVQEAADMALVAHAATLEARVPFLNIFDGFRTSHEVNTVELPTADDVRALLDEARIQSHRARALRPEAPVIRGTAQNPDVFFQAREACNPYYAAAADIVQETMDRLAGRLGRSYRLFEYVGAPDAERVIVMMGSGAGAAEEAVERLVAEGEKVGLVKVRLFRPFSVKHLLAALPPTTKAISVLDRTKEPGAPGEPLYLDIVAGLARAFGEGAAPFASFPRIVGGRYGLSSKEFTPAMVKGVFDALNEDPAVHDFVIGIEDDVTKRSLSYDPTWSTENADTVRAVFFGLGSDGTVGANKNSVKIIGEDTDNNAQGYFVYDSKKSGSMTVSHLRFGPRPINSTYLIEQAGFVACHQFTFVERVDLLDRAAPGATFLLNSPFPKEEVWNHLPARMQRQILDKKITMHVIDADSLAQEVGMGRRINTIMQVCFFALSGVLPRDAAIERIKASIVKTYGKLGEAIVKMNINAVDQALSHLAEVDVSGAEVNGFVIPPLVGDDAPAFVRDVTSVMMDNAGDSLPVSAMPVDGTFPVGTTQFEKRNVTNEIPAWDADICIQCGKCVMVCPHAVIRAKVIAPEALADAPPTFKTTKPRWKGMTDQAYSLQVAPEDCTGCSLCVEVCPVKNKSEPRLRALNMVPQEPLRDSERENWNFFLKQPEVGRDLLDFQKVKDTQLLQPLFEFSGACAGCGETPYIKLVTQLFGDRMVVANATGCSSIYGGNLPTTPWTTNAKGRGPAWANSLFEDNAEFGIGMRLSIDKQTEYARELVQRLASDIGQELADAVLAADQSDEKGINAQRERVDALRAALADVETGPARDLKALADTLVKKSVWIIGGDGWAYDIGYGGLDHVLASGQDVNILVLDTEVYSNTGGQASKATPRAAVAKFAANGKPQAKKDLGMIAMAYGDVYVARIAMGADDKQTVKALLEAEAWPGPSLVIAYSHCIAHGYDLKDGLKQQDLAVKSGHWPLFRYNPMRNEAGENPFTLDSKAPSVPLKDYIYNETRYTMLVRSKPEAAKQLLDDASGDVSARWSKYAFLAGQTGTKAEGK
ncbi:MAG: pyruvate:ferredoxin (flavodoxin) oxidoreductase [Deltaproteobacteria bacterium]|nr:MAG: pyruvate:ferredoxin (flavodoxin) oxidoreductase [Deltaproteobacteria bacterium]